MWTDRLWHGVAPFTGAWIEMARSRTRLWAGVSLPSRERGLKFWLGAMRTCTWTSLPSRERGLKSNMFDNGMPGKESLPSRERGLKSRLPHALSYGPASLPSRERGLKWVGRHELCTCRPVAPFTGAWIEILSSSIANIRAWCRSLHGSVD